MISQTVEVAGRCFQVHYDHYHEFWGGVASGAWEPEMLGLMKAVVKPTTLFVDVGAWMGPTALFAATLGAQILAFEPDPVAYRRLVRNISLNPTLRSSIEVFNAACGQEDGVITLYADALGNSESSVLNTRNHSLETSSELTKFEADVLDMREFLSGRRIRSRETFFKIDVEGAEFNLLPHVSELIRRMPRAIVNVSTHPFNVSSADLAEQGEIRRQAKMKIIDSLRGLFWLEWTERGLVEVKEEDVISRALANVDEPDVFTASTYDVLRDVSFI